MISIHKTTRKRINAFALYTDGNGTRYVNAPPTIVEWIPDPQPPEDYSEETYFRTEQDDAPYVVYTRKSDEYLLERAKERKLKQITEDRNTAIAQPVTVHGLPWQADEVSQRNLSNEILTTSAGVFLTPVWRDANNDNMTVTSIQQLVDIAAAMKLQTLTAYQTSWARKAAVEAATTVEEVDAV